jgi:hypothetical protein
MFDGLVGFFDGFFVYKTNKALIVDIWQIGLFYRSLQFLIFIYICFTLISDNQWAYAEQPVGEYNMVCRAHFHTQRAVDSSLPCPRL